MEAEINPNPRAEAVLGLVYSARPGGFMFRPSSPCLLVTAAAVGIILGGFRQVHGDDIDAWIGDLSSPQYARREAAARSLVAAGTAALGPLQWAVRSGDMELTARGVEILSVMVSATDAGTAAAAERCLTALSAEHDGHRASRLAADACAFHMLAVSETARARLESLGAIIRDRQAIDGGGLDIGFDPSWRGSPADFRELARLRGIVAVSLRGVAVDAGMLGIIRGLAGLQRLELFGTGVGAEEAQELSTRFPTARIDVRAGGRLGVSAVALTGPCEIRTVEPGSAADQAGVRSGDVVLSFDGVDVTGFEDLMARVGRHAPGDQVPLVVARPGDDPERIELRVRLDSW